MAANSLADAANRELYRNGQSFARGVSSASSGRLPGSVLKPIAAQHRTSVAEVRTAIEFANHVNLVSSIVGPKAKSLLLSGANPLLTPVLIGKLAKLQPAAMKVALKNAGDGLNPFAVPVPSEVSGEQTFWHHDLSRLRTAYDSMTAVELAMLERSSPEDRAAIYSDAAAVKVAAAALVFRFQSTDGGSNRRLTRPTSTMGVTNARKAMKSARTRIEAVTHDLPLLMTRQMPSAAIGKEFLSRVEDVHSAASRIAEATRPLIPDERKRRSILAEVATGPGDGPGTYVVVMRLNKPVVLRIGRLETFWLPDGYLLYVGSAFGAGGVRSRTTRHRSANVPKMWNLDHIKAVARPVEVWWTHSVVKVECRWAMALAELPGYRCPAPGCGSNDCKTCPAHFYHRSDRPSAEEFAEHVGRGIADHAPIYRMSLIET